MTKGITFALRVLMRTDRGFPFLALSGVIASLAFLLGMAIYMGTRGPALPPVASQQAGQAAQTGNQN